IGEPASPADAAFPGSAGALGEHTCEPTDQRTPLGAVGLALVDDFPDEFGDLLTRRIPAPHGHAPPLGRRVGFPPPPPLPRPPAAVPPGVPAAPWTPDSSCSG